jgi:hypothetical protein
MLENLIKRLPPYIGKEIFTYILPDTKSLRFCSYKTMNSKYRVVFIGDQPIQNKDGCYLTQLFKKNGEHRYYLTHIKTSRYCDGCRERKCVSSVHCDGEYRYSYRYYPRYLGKDVKTALLECSF